eukprot:g3973.t1
MARQFVVWDGQAVMGRRGTLWKAAQQLSPACRRNEQRTGGDGGGDVQDNTTSAATAGRARIRGYTNRRELKDVPNSLHRTPGGAAAAPMEQRHQVLENRDLTDLLAADLDEPFQQQAPRLLQETGTGAPTPAPSGADEERGLDVTMAPTAETMAPTPAPDTDMMTPAPVTSGASSFRSSAGVASALIFAGSVAAAAAMA